MSKPEIQKVIGSEGLERFTREGWAVIESFEEERVQQFDGFEPRGYPMDSPSPPRGHYVDRLQDHGNCQISRGLVVKERKFLVAKRVEAFFEEYEMRITSLGNDLGGEAAQRHEALKKLAESEKHSEEAAAHVDELKKEVTRLGGRLGARHAVAAKLEDDISKIRTAIGDRQMQEILAGEK